MISQMNVVQNAARLAMDHRAARPRRNPGSDAPSRFLKMALGVAIVAALVGALYLIVT